jgi:hypothetical protein
MTTANIRTIRLEPAEVIEAIIQYVTQREHQLSEDTGICTATLELQPPAPRRGKEPPAAPQYSAVVSIENVGPEQEFEPGADMHGWDFDDLRGLEYATQR